MHVIFRIMFITLGFIISTGIICIPHQNIACAQEWDIVTIRSVVINPFSPFADDNGTMQSVLIASCFARGNVNRNAHAAFQTIGNRITNDERQRLEEIMKKASTMSASDERSLIADIDMVVDDATKRIQEEDKKALEEARKRDEYRLNEIRELIATTAVKAAGTTQGDRIGTGKMDGAGAFDRPSDPRFDYYNQLHDAAMTVNNGTEHDNQAYASCTQGTSHVIRCTADCRIWDMGPTDMLAYLQGSPQWMDVNGGRDIGTFDETCQPGDIIAWDGHDAIYVGHDATRARDASSNANVYEASYGAGREGRYPGLSEYNGHIWDGVHIFRFVGKADQAPEAIRRGLVTNLTNPTY